MNKESKGTHGGARTPSPGKHLGPKPTGRRKRQFYITDTEHQLVQQYIRQIRTQETK